MRNMRNLLETDPSAWDQKFVQKSERRYRDETSHSCNDIFIIKFKGFFWYGDVKHV